MRGHTDTLRQPGLQQMAQYESSEELQAIEKPQACQVEWSGGG